MDRDPRIGTELAGYRITSLLGRGGMGVVYLAEDISLGRKTAIKILASELAQSDDFRRRFIRESQLAASLDHPNSRSPSRPAAARTRRDPAYP